MKTEKTLRLEKAIKNKFCDYEQFGVHEVTIGFGGRERADFVTITTDDIVSCFEIKVSKSDLNSKAKLTFCGHYNYLVAPYAVAKEALEKLPEWVGVLYDEDLKILRAPQPMSISAEALSVIKSSLIRSMYREINKSDPTKYNIISRELAQSKKKLKELKAKDDFFANMIAAIDAPDQDLLDELEEYYAAATGQSYISSTNPF